MLHYKKDFRKRVNLIINKHTSSYTIEEPIELLPFLLQTFSNQGRNSVKAILTRGQVSVDGQTVTQHNHPLTPGQKVAVLSNKGAKKNAVLNGVSILHEDDAIIVIDKAAGILSMASKDPSEPNAYRQLTDYVKRENARNRIFIVHRLDRDTSGVMVFAKTEDVKVKMQENWHAIVKKRVYTALVEGRVKREEGTISSWLTESKTFHVFSSPFDNGGKHAVTHYRKISGNSHYTLLEAELETGRKNQIRVHMQDLEHPVAGDKKYGARSNPLKRLGLHATTLAFTHPTTNELVQFTVKVPKSFIKQSHA